MGIVIVVCWLGLPTLLDDPQDPFLTRGGKEEGWS
jgi:hypothetical protein